jgi:hypothetical protein
MRRHGATLAGTTVRELVFRTVYSHANAEIQLRSMMIGKIAPLSRGEAERTGPYQLQPKPMGRAWEYWTTRLKKSGELPRARRGGARAGRAAKTRTSTARAGDKPRAGKKGARSLTRRAPS